MKISHNHTRSFISSGKVTPHGPRKDSRQTYTHAHTRRQTDRHAHTDRHIHTRTHRPLENDNKGRLQLGVAWSTTGAGRGADKGGSPSNCWFTRLIMSPDRSRVIAKSRPRDLDPSWREEETVGAVISGSSELSRMKTNRSIYGYY